MPVLVTFTLFGGSLLASLCNQPNLGLGLALAAYLKSLRQDYSSPEAKLKQ
jgi:hypothetical protein